MTKQNQPWLWLIGCGLASVLLMTCFVIIAAAGLIIVRRDVVTPTPASEAITPDEATPVALVPATRESVPVAAAATNRLVIIDRDGQIITLSPDGSDSRQLTSADDEQFQFPAWSPDGQHIAVIATSRRDGAIYVLDDITDAPRTELFRSTSSFPIYLSWSPNGQRVGFLAGHGGAGIGFHLADVSGDSPATLVATGSPFYWDWLDDGLNLFVHSGLVGEGSRLGFMNHEGYSAEENLAEPGFFQAPGLSATGRYLAYASLVNNQRRLIIADQTNGTEVFAQHQGFVSLSWSLTADQLAFTSPLTNNDVAFGPLRLMDAATGEVRSLDEDLVFAFFWSPDGQAIAYLTLPSEQLEDSAWLGEKGVLARPRTQQNDFQLELRLVQVATGQRRVLAQFTPSNLFLTQFLPFSDQYAISHRLWSPTSDALVLPTLDDNGDPQITVIHLDGSLPTPIAEGVMAFWSP